MKWWPAPLWQGLTVRTEHKRHRTKPPYDSAQRRQQLSESLGGNGDREAVNSRLLADKHQGTPATAAMAQPCRRDGLCGHSHGGPHLPASKNGRAGRQW